LALALHLGRNAFVCIAKAKAEVFENYPFARPQQRPLKKLSWLFYHSRGMLFVIGRGVS